MLTRIKIRQENSADENKVFELIKNTFAHAEHTDGDEHNLVNRLRESEGFIPELSLVAEFENEIIGTYTFYKSKSRRDDTACACSLNCG